MVAPWRVPDTCGSADATDESGATPTLEFEAGTISVSVEIVALPLTPAVVSGDC